MRWSGWWLLLAGCAGDGGDDGGKDTGSTTDETTGTGSGIAWAPAGEGKAFFLDGEADNSKFHLELTRCLAPRDGESYYGFVSRAGADPIALGAIPVSSSAVLFEYELGIDASLGGYDSFEAWANDSGTAGEGELLWQGQVDPAVVAAIANILIASVETADGQGTARALESSLQDLRTYTEDVIAREGEIEETNAEAERISNSISGLNEDLDGNGSVELVPGNPGVLGANGYLTSILAELDSIALIFAPTDPVRDYINYAYDCLQRVDDYGSTAYRYSSTAAGCAATATCNSLFETTLENLVWAADGKDIDEDGTIAQIDEGSVECGIAYIAQMSSMDVRTP